MTHDSDDTFIIDHLIPIRKEITSKANQLYLFHLLSVHSMLSLFHMRITIFTSIQAVVFTYNLLQLFKAML